MGTLSAKAARELSLAETHLLLSLAGAAQLGSTRAISFGQCFGYIELRVNSATVLVELRAIRVSLDQVLISDQGVIPEPIVHEHVCPSKIRLVRFEARNLGELFLDFLCRSCRDYQDSAGSRRRVPHQVNSYCPVIAFVTLEFGGVRGIAVI